MRTATSLVSMVLTAALLAPRLRVQAGGEYCRPQMIADLVRDSTSDDVDKSRAAIAQLRTLGPDGLQALCDEHDRQRAASSDALPDSDSGIARLRLAIDAVAKQRDAHASRLYWFTDLDEAKSQAAASGKAILSLRLLGNLDDDRSCANSRFFRSVLYANAQVSAYLREHYILHWESLRPVPQLTIDFGDGRRIERTITGNSIHYILDWRGEIIDALPGLYGPAAFLRGVQAAERALRQSRMMADAEQGEKFLRHWHAAAVVRLDHELRRDLNRLNQELIAPPVGPNIAGQPLAVPAAAIARSKMRAEVKAVEAVIDAPGAVAKAAAALDDARWASIAALHAEDAALDATSVALITSKLPADIANAAQSLTKSKREVETPVMRMLREFRQSVAIDSVRNEYELHRTIHEWLAQPRSRSAAPLTVKAFNERVYAELFQTPLDDPWMGLAPRDAYAALDGGGLIDGCS